MGVLLFGSAQCALLLSETLPVRDFQISLFASSKRLAALPGKQPGWVIPVPPGTGGTRDRVCSYTSSLSH